MIKWREQLTVPNILTMVRLACIPWMAQEIYQSRGYSGLSAALFMGIWFTDILDGWIARRFKQVSDLGKVLDPLVDKIFQLTTAIMMWVVGRLPLWVPIAMLAKELLMVAGGIILWKKQYVVSSKWYGKITTVLIAMAFVVIFFLPEQYVWLSPYIFILPIAMLYFSLFSYAANVWRLWNSGVIAAGKEVGKQQEDINHSA